MRPGAELRLSQLPLLGSQDVLKLCSPGFQCFDLSAVLLHQCLERLQVLRRHLAAGGALQKRLILLGHLPIGIGQGAAFLLHPLLKLPEAAGLEDLPEDLDAILGLGLQKAQEVPLGDHGNLGKLAAVEPQKLRHRRRHLLPAGEGLAVVGEAQKRLGLLHRKARAPLLGALVLRGAAHRIFPAPAQKGELHKGGLAGLGIVAAKHVRLAGTAAGLAVEGEADGVKNGGLARAGVPGDEIEPPLPQLGEGQRHRTAVGAKGAHG